MGVPAILSVIIGAGGTLVVPLYMADRIAMKWDTEFPQVARAHPFSVLARVRSLRRTGYLIDTIVIVITAFLVTNRIGFAELFSTAPLYLGLLELWPVELAFFVLRLNFSWAPDPLAALRAAILSESDPEKGAGKSVLDDSIYYFNRLSAKKLGLVLSPDLSPDIHLTGSPTRSIRISNLLGRLNNREDLDYLGFIADISNIVRKPVSEVLEKASLLSSLARNKGTILGVLGVVVPILVALSPYLIPHVLTPIVSQWSKVFH